jgi:hypothetical protein
MKADCPTDSTLPPNAVLIALNSLYDDELKPNLGLLRRRLKELYDVLLPVQDLREIIHRLADAKILHVEGDSKEPVLMLTSRPAGSLIDPTDPSEPYDQEIFQRMRVMMDAASASDPPRLYKGGRYGMAQQLRSVEMPELRSFSLGRVCHLVQRAIDKKIVGYKKGGSLVPYRLSDSLLKSTAEANDLLLESDLPAIKTMAELRAVLTKLWMNPKHRKGLPLSRVKDEIRQSAKHSLSEQLLGFGKLSQLLTAPELEGSCNLSHEYDDVLLYPPFLGAANEGSPERPLTACPRVPGCKSSKKDPKKTTAGFARSTAIISSSSKREPATAATDISSGTASPALTFASEVSDASSVPTADGLAGVPPPLRLPELFSAPPAPLPDLPLLPPLAEPVPEMLPSMISAALTLAAAAAQLGDVDLSLPELMGPACQDASRSQTPPPVYPQPVYMLVYMY